MTGPERGYLLLCSQLGDPERRPLTPPQLRRLFRRARHMPPPEEQRQLEMGDLTSMGIGAQEAARILGLLSEEPLLDYYLEKGRKAGCRPITRVSPHYPQALKARLGEDAPGCLWAKGELSLLEMPKISLVGSRELRPGNRRFAAAAGQAAARQGYALVSGNARGADQTAQRAALDSGGRVISVVADSLEKHKPQPGVLYLSLDAFEADFSAFRALTRNAVIHALGEKVLVAQCSLETGGTWAGTRQNLRRGCSPVFCFRDGSPAAARLEALGADLITENQLEALQDLQPSRPCFL